MEKMDTQQLIRHIHRSDLTALEKRYLEGLVEARTPREGMRLIDADALKKRIGVVVNSMIEGDETETELKFFRMIDYVLESSVDETPTIEAEPVRHGRWICRSESKSFSDYSCSECDAAVMTNAVYKIDNFHYCHSCGARMDGGEDGK